MLTIRNLHSKTHAGLIAMFEEGFGPHPILGRALSARMAADYGREPFLVTREALAAQLSEARTFVAECHRIVQEALARGPDEPDPPADL